MEDSHSASTSNAGLTNSPSKRILIATNSKESETDISQLDLVNLKSRIKGVLKAPLAGKTVTVKQVYYKLPGKAESSVAPRILTVVKKPSQLQQPIKDVRSSKPSEVEILVRPKTEKDKTEQKQNLNVISNTVVNFSKDEIRKFVSRVSDAADKDKKPASVIIEKRGRCKGSIAVIEGSENIRFTPKAVIKQYPGRVPISKEQEKRIAEEQLRELEEEEAKEQNKFPKKEIDAKRKYIIKKKVVENDKQDKVPRKRGRPSKKVANQENTRRSARTQNKVIDIASSTDDNSDIEYNSESEEEDKKRNKLKKMETADVKAQDNLLEKTEEKTVESNSPSVKRNSVDKADGEPPVKKGRGRPRKNDSVPKKPVEKEIISPSTRPQRSRKQVNYLEMLNPRTDDEPDVVAKRRNSVNTSSDSESPKKKRGRKKRVVENSEESMEEADLKNKSVSNQKEVNDNDLKDKSDEEKERTSQSESDKEKSQTKSDDSEAKEKAPEDKKDAEDKKPEEKTPEDEKVEEQTSKDSNEKCDGIAKESSDKTVETEHEEDKTKENVNKESLEDSKEKIADSSDAKIEETVSENKASTNGSTSDDKSITEIKSEDKNDNETVPEKVKEVTDIINENKSVNDDVKESDDAVKSEGNQ